MHIYFHYRLKRNAKKHLNISNNSGNFIHNASGLKADSPSLVWPHCQVVWFIWRSLYEERQGFHTSLSFPNCYFHSCSFLSFQIQPKQNLFKADLDQPTWVGIFPPLAYCPLSYILFYVLHHSPHYCFSLFIDCIFLIASFPYKVASLT